MPSLTPFPHKTHFNIIIPSTPINFDQKFIRLSHLPYMCCVIYQGADKSLARPERKHTRKHVRDARGFNNIETQALTKFFFFFFLQGKAPKDIHAILTETLACFLPGRAKGLSATLCLSHSIILSPLEILLEFVP